MPNIPQDYYRIIPVEEIRSDALSAPLTKYFHDLDKLDRRKPLHVFNFSQFMMSTQLGFEHIYYEAHNLPIGDDMGIFWINEEHAINIAKVLNSKIKSLELRLSCEEENAFITMSQNITQGTSIEKLIIKHMTYDEVTQSEIRGLARLICNLSVQDFSLYSADFQSGIFDAFVSEMNTLGNKNLKKCSIYDVTRPEGENEVSISVLDRWLKKH